MTKAELIKMLQNSSALDDVQVIVSTQYDTHCIIGLKDLDDGVLYLETDS